MVVNRKVTGRAMSMPAGISAGIVIAIAITIFGAVVVAWAVSREMLVFHSIGYGAMLILLAASIIGAMSAKALVKHRALVVCLGTGVGYFLSLLAITALFFGGQYRGVGTTFALVCAGAGTAGMLGNKKKKSITKGYRKLRTG